jgi:cytochrome c-type biogenesis protein CcmH
VSLRRSARARRASRPTPAALTAAVTVLALLAALVSPFAAAAAVTPRTTLPVMERQAMCVTCKIPLNVAESPQATLERRFIQGLINEGEDESEIKKSLVNQYGPTVLGLPSTHGFDLTVYVVPAVIVLLLLGVLAMLLPSWRRHARAAAERETPASALPPSDAARLESDLARFD